MKNFITTLMIFILSLVISCDKDYEGLNVNTPTVETQVAETQAEQNARIEGLISSNTITGDFIVSTIDELGSALPDVTITINNINYSTGTIANAIIEDITVNEDYIFITAEKTGFEKVMKTITPSKNGLTNVSLMLLVDIPSQSLNVVRGVG